MKKSSNQPKLDLENAFWKQNKLVVGVDEVGRGCLSGPVVAACVVLEPKKVNLLHEVNDSKKLKSKKRRELFDLIIDNVRDYSIGISTADEIDKINILQATFLAMRRSLEIVEYDHILVDGNHCIAQINEPQTPVIKGDSRSLSIASASIIAKVFRDTIMIYLEKYYPGYGFSKHKGYPTKQHRQAVKDLGLTPQHRKTFCRNILQEQTKLFD